MTSVCVGLGLSSAATAEEVRSLVDAVLATAGRTLADVTALATIDTRVEHPALTALGALGPTIVTFPAEVLARVDVPNPSATVAEHVSTASVAEAAALTAMAALVASPTILVGKTTSRHATAAVAG